jgi:hypothetical protein
MKVRSEAAQTCVVRGAKRQVDKYASFRGLGYNQSDREPRRRTLQCVVDPEGAERRSHARIRSRSRRLMNNAD